jgi:hypothetical protein
MKSKRVKTLALKYLKKVNLMYLWIILTPVFLAALIFFSYLPKLQFQVLTLAAIIYLILALLHHLRDKSLTWEITIEYALIAILSLIILGDLLI